MNQNELREELSQVLFKIGQELKVHKLDADNLIVEIDYNKYLDQIIELFNKEKQV